MSGFTINPFSGFSSTLLTDLIAWWPMDETSGTRNDSHTNALHLDDNLTVLYDTGKVSNAANFARTNAEFLDRAASDSELNPSGDLTIAGWLKPATFLVTASIFSKYATAGNQRGWHMHVGTDGSAAFIASADGTAASNCVWSANLVVDTWYHFLCYYDGTANEIGIQVDNGTAVTTSFTGPINASTSPFHLGRLPATSNYYDGLMDEVAVWSRLLTSDEKATIYNSGAGTGYPS